MRRFKAALSIKLKTGNNPNVLKVVNGKQRMVYSYNGIFFTNKKE